MGAGLASRAEGNHIPRKPGLSGLLGVGGLGTEEEGQALLGHCVSQAEAEGS